MASKDTKSSSSALEDESTANVDQRQPIEESFVGETKDTQPTLSIVLPTYNEEEGVSECIEQVKEAIRETKLSAEIIVSDSSTDETPNIASELGARVVEPPERGYGNAYKYAFEQTRGRYIVIGDADTTYDFTELPKLLEPVIRDEADIVLGSRFLGEIKPGSMPWLHKYVGNPLLTKLLNWFYDAEVTDAHSGFRVFSRDAFERLDLQSDGMEFASEMVMEAAENGLRIEEVPITYHERVGVATLESFTDGWRHVRFMILNAPSSFFFLSGGVLWTVGIVTVAVSLLGSELAAIPFDRPLVAVGSVSLIVGYQISSLGVFSTAAADPIKKSRGRLTNWLAEKLELEQGVMAGVAVFATGVLAAGYPAYLWTSGQSGSLPAVPSLLALTLMVLGIQTVFNSFCLSVLRWEEESP